MDQVFGLKVTEALIKARKNFGAIKKNTHNSFFKSKYADLSTCLDELSPALLEQAILIIQKTHESNSQNCVGVETILLHSSGEFISSGVLNIPVSKCDPQGYGSAITYARRYSLLAVCGVATEDDDGNEASNNIEFQQVQKIEKKEDIKTEKPTPSQINFLKKLGYAGDIDSLSKFEASKKIDELSKKNIAQNSQLKHHPMQDNNVIEPATEGQLAYLRKLGYAGTEPLTVEQANSKIEQIIALKKVAG